MAVPTPHDEFEADAGEAAVDFTSTRRPRGKAQVEPEDLYLVALAKNGSAEAYDRLVRRYRSFVRLKASMYFMRGGNRDDLHQEGLLGLFKAVRDYRSDRESSFRNFAELCITRQIITAVKTADRNKHSPLNGAVSFSHSPAVSGDGEATLEDILPGPISDDPADQIIASEELSSLVVCLQRSLSPLESDVLALYLDGESYDSIASRLDCSTKKVDNALQRIKRKVGMHRSSRDQLLQ